MFVKRKKNFYITFPPHEEPERLYQTVANDIEQLAAGAVQKVLSDKCKE
jgi:hypothetical protein